MFSFERGPDIETVSSKSEFSEAPLTYGMMTIPWYTVSEEGRLLLDGFVVESTNSCECIQHQIKSYVIKLPVDILMNRIYVLGPTDQTMDSLFHVRWVVGLELLIMTCISRFPVHVRDQFGTPLHDQGVQERNN